MKQLHEFGPSGRSGVVRGSRTLWLVIGILHGCVTPGGLLAQGTLVDEGEFRILIRGLDVGSETFVIRRSGAGAERSFTAQGKLSLETSDGRLEMTTTLGAKGPNLRPTGYQRNVSGARTEEVRFSLQDRRFVVRISTEAGEELRELRPPEGGLLLEESVAHQFHFVIARFLAGERSIPVIRPETRTVSVLELEERDQTSIQARGQRIEVRRLRVSDGDRFWEAWFDNSGRILRLENPVEGFRAERIDPPF